MFGFTATISTPQGSQPGPIQGRQSDPSPSGLSRRACAAGAQHRPAFAQIWQSGCGLSTSISPCFAYRRQSWSNSLAAVPRGSARRGNSSVANSAASSRWVVGIAGITANPCPRADRSFAGAAAVCLCASAHKVQPPRRPLPSPRPSDRQIGMAPRRRRPQPAQALAPQHPDPQGRIRRATGAGGRAGAASLFKGRMALAQHAQERIRLQGRTESRLGTSAGLPPARRRRQGFDACGTRREAPSRTTGSAARKYSIRSLRVGS